MYESDDHKEILKSLIKDFILGEKLLHIEDKDTKRFMEILDDANLEIDDSELFKEVIDSGELVAIIGERIDRAKQLKPLFLSSRPNKETETYFNEAINCWFYGLDTASLILTYSTVEYILKKKLAEDLGFVKLVKKCKEKHVLSQKACNELYKLAGLRNKAVHESQKIESDDAYRAIELLKKIISHLDQSGEC